MAGLYIHIPFCRKVCTYCDFYKTTAISGIPPFLEALEKEMALRSGYLHGASLSTVYLGGGTPSLLDREALVRLFARISQHFTLETGCEITLEANPDDLSPSWLSDLHRYTPVNRLSIGIQSFSDSDLALLGRRHTAAQAVHAIEDAQRAGFTNLTADLIYGLPDMEPAHWEAGLRQVFSMGIRHLSAYHLTIEPGTALARMHGKGLLRLPPEDKSRTMFRLLHNMAQEQGFLHYEISNLALEGFHSRHNSNYWNQQPYLGLGPSAHSFDLESRRWNVARVSSYVEALQEGKPFFEAEQLGLQERYNELVMLSLRTAVGIDLEVLESRFGASRARETVRRMEQVCRPEWWVREGPQLRLTAEGWMVSDYIAGELMWV